MKKQILFLMMIIAVMGVVSGCGKKQLPQNNQVALNNQALLNQEQIGNHEQQPEVLISDIDVSDWKIYRNEELGFEVKYPKGWENSVDKTGFIKFMDPKQKAYYEGSEIYLIGIGKRNFENQNQLDEYVKNWGEIKTKRGGLVKNLLLNDKNVIQGSDYLGLDTIITKDGSNSIYIITKVIGPSDYPLIDELNNGILDSLKFIN